MVNKTKQNLYNLLRWSEKWTKTDMIYLVSGSFWLTIGQIISSSSGLLLAIAFANLLPKEIYGNYKYALSLISLLSIPTLAGMGTALTQSVARGYEGSFPSAIKSKIKWGLSGGLASILLAGYYHYNNNNLLTISFLIAGVFIPFKDSLSVYTAIPAGRKLFKLSTKYSTIRNVIYAFLMITVLFITKNVIIIIFSFLALNSLLNLLIAFAYLKKLNLNKKEDPNVIHYGKHLSLVSIIGLIASQLDKLLLFHFLGSTEVAIYFFALAPIDQIKGPIKNLGTLAFPKFATRDIKYLKTNIYNKMFLLFLALLLITATYLLISPILFKLFFPQYIEAIPYSRLYSFSLLFLPTIFVNKIFLAHKKIKEIYFISTVNSISKILLFLFLIPLFGINGAIMAIILNNTISLILWVILFKKS